MSAFGRRFMRWLPLAVLAALLIVVVAMGWYRYLSFSSLSTYHKFLEDWTHAHYALSTCIFILSYIVSVAISLPGATFLTLLGGYLFGIVAGTVYVVFGATVGAVLLFLAVKTALGNWLQRKAHGWVSRMEIGFQKNAFNYLLFLRLVPIFPFWVINIVPALLNVRMRIFFVATLIGIIPGSLVYVAVGNGLGRILEQGGTPDLSIIFQPSILIPIVCLALLSLLPVVYKKVSHRHD